MSPNAEDRIWASINAEDLTPVQKLAALIMKIGTTAEEPFENSVDVGFFHVGLLSEGLVSSEEFQEAVRAALTHAEGAFTRMDFKRMLEGPSYIELGGWIGDQGVALALIGLGKTFGLWDAMTPKRIGITGEIAQQMLGMGFVSPIPSNESPLQSWAMEETGFAEALNAAVASFATFEASSRGTDVSADKSIDEQ